MAGELQRFTLSKSQTRTNNGSPTKDEAITSLGFFRGFSRQFSCFKIAFARSERSGAEKMTHDHYFQGSVLIASFSPWTCTTRRKLRSLFASNTEVHRTANGRKQLRRCWAVATHHAAQDTRHSESHWKACGILGIAAHATKSNTYYGISGIAAHATKSNTYIRSQLNAINTRRLTVCQLKALRIAHCSPPATHAAYGSHPAWHAACRRHRARHAACFQSLRKVCGTF